MSKEGKKEAYDTRNSDMAYITNEHIMRRWK
jgi:hypothetical protein